MKQKGKRKKDREGQHVIVKKYKSFVKSKHIFWKQGTDAKSLFSRITEIRMDEFIELMKEIWVSRCRSRAELPYHSIRHA